MLPIHRLPTIHFDNVKMCEATHCKYTRRNEQIHNHYERFQLISLEI